MSILGLGFLFFFMTVYAGEGEHAEYRTSRECANGDQQIKVRCNGSELRILFGDEQGMTRYHFVDFGQNVTIRSCDVSDDGQIVAGLVTAQTHNEAVAFVAPAETIASDIAGTNAVKRALRDGSGLPERSEKLSVRAPGVVSHVAYVHTNHCPDRIHLISRKDFYPAGIPCISHATHALILQWEQGLGGLMTCSVDTLSVSALQWMRFHTIGYASDITPCSFEQILWNRPIMRHGDHREGDTGLPTGNTERLTQFCRWKTPSLQQLSLEYLHRMNPSMAEHAWQRLNDGISKTQCAIQAYAKGAEEEEKGDTAGCKRKRDDS